MDYIDQYLKAKKVFSLRFHLALLKKKIIARVFPHRVWSKISHSHESNQFQDFQLLHLHFLWKIIFSFQLV